jgi:hypothetical protein
MSSSPVKIITMYNVYLVYCSHMEMLDIFNSALGQPDDCRDDRPFPYHVTGCGVRTGPPLFPRTGWTFDRLFNPIFEA